MRNTIAWLLLAALCQGAFAERPIVSEIRAQLKGSAEVSLSWTLPREPDSPLTGLVLYRDTKPISSFKALRSAEKIAELPAESTNFTDRLTDSLAYFYAAVSVTESGSYEVVLQGLNSTAASVRRSAYIQAAEPAAPPLRQEKAYPAGTSREAPLPPLNTGTAGRQRQINDRAKKSAESLVRSVSVKKTVEMAPHVFEQDYFSQNGGDDYFLFQALHKTFARRDYKGAITELSVLVGTNLDESVVTRARFYLGQSYFFTGDYNNAVRYFLATSDKYPELSKKWIDAAIDNISPAR